MRTITIRNLPDDIHDAIKSRANKNHRSAEAEIRAILDTVTAPERSTGFGQELHALWGDTLGDDLQIVRDQTPSDPDIFK